MSAAWLHDVLEDTNTTYYEPVENFGYKIASLVMELTTCEEMKNEMGKEKYLAYKMKHMTSWALVVKLCDRLDNINNMNGFTESRKQNYIKGTKFIINYLKENRELSDTHLAIIKEIEKYL